MLEFKNTQGLTSSLNPRNLVELLYRDIHTSASGTRIIFSDWSDETAETAESLAARVMTQARIVNFRILVDGKPSIPVWFNADAVVEVWETKTGHCAIIAEPRTFTLVAESYREVLDALAAAKVMLSPERTKEPAIAAKRGSRAIRTEKS